MRPREPEPESSAKRLKRTDTEVIDTSSAEAEVTRQPSILIARQHGEARRVLLRPRVEVKEDKITRVIISRLQRTPSPFGSRMGDHTVAWQAVVDQLSARLFGLSVAEAVNTLNERQRAVSEWMADADSDARKMLIQLEDAVARRTLLEDAAFQANELLESAAKADTAPAMQQGLEQAITWHLTYLNYLPFATVPAMSARGSHGSSEGRDRAVLLTEDRNGPPPTPAVIAGNAAALRDALLGLFAFEAAMREANVEIAVVPSIA